MVILQKTIPSPGHMYPLERIGKAEEIFFFDIETTGFSGDSSRLYLIGGCFFKNGSWNLIQWFADTLKAEEELLHSFFSFLKPYRILVHFNGDGFDIPYLLKRCRHYCLPYDFSSVTSLDLYKKIKPYQKILGLDSLRQKSIEHFLGVSRQDVYTGGQLIPVYKDYLATCKKPLMDLLTLHNEDDLKGMAAILPILCYPDFLEHPMHFVSQQFQENPDPLGSPQYRLSITCESDYEIPVPFQAQTSYVECLAERNRLTLSVRLFSGTLKHFYPNYKDYYYLIYEDAAVHKSVGEYVDKSARKKATAKTCYTKKEGCFLPQFEPVWEPAMKQGYTDKICYASLPDISWQDEKMVQRYLCQVLEHLKQSSKKARY
ncbi:MAG: ribonuclease H-like domain-containing protein [Lachnospiraceae bacterium]|nr:ribonuclease H-like domain-containing protein [Lachnospiraceae bacterium]